MLKNDVVTVQFLKEGGLPPTDYGIPEVSLAVVLKKEKNRRRHHILICQSIPSSRFYLDEKTYEKKKRKDLRLKETSPDMYTQLKRERLIPLNLFAYEDQPQ